MPAERQSETKLRRSVAAAVNSRGAPSPHMLTARRINRLKDDVYREMLLLESHRPGAEMALALALLRAAAQAASVPVEQDFQRWLSEVCALGLNMIEASLKQHATCAEAG